MALLRPAFPRLQRGHPLARGLVGAWEFTEGAGAAAYDSSGYGNHGVFSGVPNWVGGPSGSAMKFVAASGNGVTAPSPAQFSGAIQATICGWVYRESTSDHIGVGLGSADSLFRFDAAWYTDANYYFSVANNDGNQYSFVTLGGVGFHHFCLVFNGALSGNARVAAYVDGVPQALTYNATPPATLPTNAQMGSFRIGTSLINGDSDGIAYGVRAYARALSAEEVRVGYATDSQGLFRPSSAAFLSAIAGAQEPPPPWPPAGAGPLLHVVSTPMRW